MSKLTHKTNSAAEEREARMDNQVRMVANKQRCKHGMLFEYCGLCQAYHYEKDYKFPIDKIDEETGEPVKIWLRGTTTRTGYYRYRNVKEF